MIKTHLAIAQQRYDEAQATILPLYRIAPENRATQLKLAQVYILNKKTNDAQLILNALAKIGLHSPITHPIPSVE